MSHPNGRRPRRRAWRIESLEARDLLSVAPMLYREMAREHAAALSHAGSTPSQTAATSNIVQLKSSPFTATMYGNVRVGPGRVAGQSQLILYRGAGTSNQFLHGWFQMSFATPTDPTAPIQGNADLIEKNVGQSGTELILDVTADPNSLVNGVPTRFAWTVDGASSGFYIGASGSGTGQIVYVTGGHAPQHVGGAVNFGVRLQGTIGTTPVTNILVF